MTRRILATARAVDRGTLVAQHNVGEDVDPISRRSLLGAGVGAAVGLSATTAPAAAREIDPRSDMTLRELKQLDHQLAACDVPEAADLREAFAAL
jgi:hypothetical protein